MADPQLGNYKSFGDTKFVPDVPPVRFKLFMDASAAPSDKVEALWKLCAARMWSLPPRRTSSAAPTFVTSRLALSGESARRCTL